jgi:hypothetical protein
LAHIGIEYAIVCTSEERKLGFCSLHPQTKTQTCTPTSSLLFFWAAWASGNDALEGGYNSTFSNLFADGLLISREISKVSFELLKGFSVTSEKWKQQGMF